MEKPAPHRWKFIRIGGVLQVVFRSGEDIINLEHLDQKLWVALACPTRGVEFDERTLDLLDFDRDGRVRAPEVIQITRWVRDVFKDPDVLLKGSDSVTLSTINESNPAGAAILASAQRVLSRAGKTDAPAVTLSDVTELTKTFGAAKFNGDAIVPADSAPDDDTKKALLDILSTHAGVPDQGGKPGITQPIVDAFFTEATALLAWHKRSQTEPGILAFGDKTAPAAAALAPVRSKINDYFARVSLALFDPQATRLLNSTEAELTALAAKDLRTDSPEIAELPLANIAPGKPLPLNTGLNPAWQQAMAAFLNNTCETVLGARNDTLSEDDWKTLQAKLQPYEHWLASKPVTPAEKLGFARLQELVDSGYREKLTTLVQQDAAEARMNDDARSVERLIRVQRDLFRFLNNFVSFSDFYSRRGAIFQAGTLYLDARSCELCVHVIDQPKHALLAGLAKAYLAYCDCTRIGGKKMTIAAAFTAGDSDHLMVGRNGVFYDRNGVDWDATITKIIDNPISIQQAFWSPYKKFVRMIEEQIAKRAAAAEAASQASLTTAATTVATADLTKPPTTPPPKPPEKKVDVGTVAALGVALGSLATFLGLMFTRVIDMGWWAPFAVLGIILAISCPSMLIAWLKLRQRNLGPILDANGWAVNGRMKINVPFGGALSKRAVLPQNAQVQLDDPFYESHAGRHTVIALIVLAVLLGTLWRFGFLDRFLPPSLDRKKPTEVLIVPAAQISSSGATGVVVTTPAPTNTPPLVTNK